MRKTLSRSTERKLQRVADLLAIDRRRFLGLSAAMGVAAAVPEVAAADRGEESAGAGASFPGSVVEEASIADLQGAMSSGDLTALGLVDFYLARIEAIDRSGPDVHSILEVNPAARAIAKKRDKERASGTVRGPLHGIPILLKDNIDTGDAMQTTAGSLALVGDPAVQDATVAQRLRAAGAVILGKTNLSEWANFRGFNSSSGWSGRGGQTRNPYVIDRNPCGSSSGSAAAVSASLAAAALGTETDGSIVCPSSTCGVVGIKPTVGLTSRAGVVPISSTQDTVGPHGRTVADAAAVLGALVGVDPRDPATAGSAGQFHTDYTQFLDPDGLSGMRIGVHRDSFTGYSGETDAIFEEALAAMADAGAVLVDPDGLGVKIPTIEFLNTTQDEIIVLVFEFKRDVNAYLATRTGVPVHSLADLIAFNEAHAEQELKFFGQELLELADFGLFSEAEYLEAVVRGPLKAGPEGIDAVLAEHDLDALVAPTGSPAWPTDLVNGDHFLGASSYPAAMAGYPLINVTAGFTFGLPVGISFMAGAYSEPTLIKLASGFEHVSNARRKPRFRKNLQNLDAPRETVARAAPSRSSLLGTSASFSAMRRLLSGRL